MTGFVCFHNKCLSSLPGGGAVEPLDVVGDVGGTVGVVGRPVGVVGCPVGVVGRPVGVVGRPVLLVGVVSVSPFSATESCCNSFYKYIRNQKSEICLFNPFISYIEYSLIYIYKHMGQGDIC